MFLHQPVLREKVVDYLRPVLGEGSVVIDATVGSGGHAEALLQAGAGRLIAVDRDPEALQRARQRLAGWGDRVTYVHEDFRHILKVALSHAPLGLVDAVLVDLGVSMDQLKDPRRGFSFDQEGPLDMRMNPWDAETAERIVNQRSFEDLVRIFRDYGEEPRAEAVARAIVEARKRGPITTTTQLAEIVRGVIRRRGRTDPATRVFMALRIAVNRELEGLDVFFVDAFHVLRVGGRLAVLAYHSLEDRVVKRIFHRLALPCRCEPQVGVCVCEGQPLGRVLTPKPVRPDPAEVRRNPASRSARLRVIEKLAPVRFRDRVYREPRPRVSWPGGAG
jgi:16S rRNA (cytosine1402-N4)-methyltransferase